MQKINVLWTGGFDSTYRIAELSKKPVIIQPIYLSDNRKCESNELKAIEDISKEINSLPETICTLLPVIIYDVTDVEANPEITASWKEIRKKVRIGTQYDWLARYSHQTGMKGLELGIEKAESGQVVSTFEAFNVKLDLVTDGHIQYYKIDERVSNKHVVNVFGQFHYPYPLYEMTKTDTLQAFEGLGLEHLVEKTWFCHNPIRNKPCGVCNPCKSTLSEGMDFRFPKSSIIRSKFRLLYRTKERLGNLIAKTRAKLNR